MLHGNPIAQDRKRAQGNQLAIQIRLARHWQKNAHGEHDRQIQGILSGGF